MKKKKIAVLGSGMSAMSTIFELMKTADFQEKYDITIYQMGWRIGGKGASGRQHVPDKDQPEDHNQRIREHGLHSFFGWYTNAFRQFRDLYDHLDWTSDHPFYPWYKAFTPEDYVSIMEEVDGDWKPWDFFMHSLPMEPGDGDELMSLDEYIRLAFDLLKNHLLHPKAGLGSHKRKRGILGWIWHEILILLFWLFRKFIFRTVKRILNRIEKILLKKDTETLTAGHVHHGEIIDLFEKLGRRIYWEIGHLMAKHWETKKFFILFDVGLTCLKGLIKDNVLAQGLNSINNVDFREWLIKHGATDISTQSVLVRIVYDGCFAYARGNKNTPNLEAGVAIRYCIGIALGSKKHWLWKMNAGMGDTIFSPYYDFFKKQGVKFKFFHKVKELKLSQDQRIVEEIIIEHQATVKPEFAKGYQPTFKYQGVDCWPHEPFYDQLIEGEELKKLKKEGKNVNLESFWSEWRGVGTSTLTHGTDFDVILLNIPIAAHIFVCPQLVANNQRWFDMLDNVETNQTISVQLWLTKTAKELGWPAKGREMTGFVEPLDTYADMSHLLKSENWGGKYRPASLTYLVSAFPDNPNVPPVRQHSYPAYMNSLGKKAGITFLKKYMKFIYPGVGEQSNFDWNDLYDPAGREGEDRFDAQYWLVNVDPSERYTLSVRGSSNYRLRADESGYQNVFFAGDWTDNGLNVGCIEACVISGMRAAAAISGEKIKIAGDNGIYQMT